MTNEVNFEKLKQRFKYSDLYFEDGRFRWLLLNSLQFRNCSASWRGAWLCLSNPNGQGERCLCFQPWTSACTWSFELVVVLGDLNWCLHICSLELGLVLVSLNGTLRCGGLVGACVYDNGCRVCVPRPRRSCTWVVYGPQPNASAAHLSLSVRPRFSWLQYVM